MNQAFVEMKRMLKGKICIVIGNISLKVVEILNAEVFCRAIVKFGIKNC
jgi:hypothetical protein